MANNVKLCIRFNLSDPDQKKAYSLIRDTSKNGRSLGKSVSELIVSPHVSPQPSREVSLSDDEAERIANIISRRLIENKLFPATSSMLNDIYENNNKIDPQMHKGRTDRKDDSNAALHADQKTGASYSAAYNTSDVSMNEPNIDAMNAIYKMMGMDV